MTDTLDLSALRSLKQMIGGETDDLAELIADFVTGLPVQVEQMRLHGGNSDLAALRIAAHSCKSNARDLGALRLSQLCAQLETECVSAKIIDLPAHLAKIAQAADATLANLAQLDVADV